MFQRTIEITLIKYEICLILTWSKDCSLFAGTVASSVPTYSRTDTKLYVPVVTGFLLDYQYFKKYYKVIAKIYVSNKNQVLIQKQYNKLILLEIQIEFQIFQKEQLNYYDFILFKYNVNIKITKYNTLNLVFSDLQLNQLNSGIKNNIEVTFSSSLIGNSKYEAKFPYYQAKFPYRLSFKFKAFVKIELMVHQLILHLQKLSYLRRYSQEDLISLI